MTTATDGKSILARYVAALEAGDERTVRDLFRRRRDLDARRRQPADLGHLARSRRHSRDTLYARDTAFG